MADIFNRKDQTVKTPLTADKCAIVWDDELVTQAFQFQASYQQQVTRRRSIGNNEVVIYGSQPQGQIQIGRIMVSDTDTSKLFGSKSWTCGGGTLEFYTGSCKDEDEGQGPVHYFATGCIVTGYTISANAEDLTVVDNITIEFLQLSTDGQ
jgi:hypothetical protein